MKNAKDLIKDMDTMKILSVTSCNGEFHVFPFVIMYLYANERLSFIKAEKLNHIKGNIIIEKDLYESFKKKTITQEELADYNSNIDYYVLTAQLGKNSRTDILVQLALETTLELMRKKATFGGVSDAMFKLYNLLSTYPPAIIKEKLHLIFLEIIDFFFYSTTPIQDYYGIRNLKNCKELSKLMVGLFPFKKKGVYDVVHPMAGPANFIEYMNENVTYHATMKDCRFLCLYQLYSDVVKKNAKLLPYVTDDIINLQAEYIVFDDISIGYKVWEIIAQTADTAKQGVFLIENDVLFEFNNNKLCKGLDGIDLLRNHISHVIFLPNGLALISVCEEKESENVILVDECHSKNICATTIVNHVVCMKNSYVLTPEEYASPNFVFELNRILSKLEKINDGIDIIRLKDILSPSEEIGQKICAWEMNTFDYDYSRFNPFYTIHNGTIINQTEKEAKEDYRKSVLLLDLITKQKFQPKILYYDKIEYSLSIDEFAYNIKEGVVDFNYLINEMNKKYFVDQIFPTDVITNAAFDWEDLAQCYIKLPAMHNTVTPIERQKLLLNEEKMDFINKLLRNYDYDVEKFIKGDKASLKKNTILNGGYRIVKCLGSGGFGKTYKAIKLDDGGKEKTVAIKEFFDSSFQKRAEGSNNVVCLSGDIKHIVEARNKFFTEAKKIQKYANCENIIKVYEVFDENNTSYYSMEYIEGDNLHDYVEKKGKLNEEEALRIIRGVANALREMHNERMLHMDVKPGNIMVCKNGRVVLIDFGGAHKYNASSQMNSTFVRLNSPGFTPPEQIGGSRFSAAYDIYSLGATLHYMLSGNLANKYSEESQIYTDEYNVSLQNELSDDISNDTKECINKSMNYFPKCRPQSIDEFLAMLPCE